MWPSGSFFSLPAISSVIATRSQPHEFHSRKAVKQVKNYANSQAKVVKSCKFQQAKLNLRVKDMLLHFVFFNF